MTRDPDYKEKSEAVLAECNDEALLKSAREEIYKTLTDSVQKIKSLVHSKDDAIALRAAREHLLLAGLYVEKSEVNNKGTMSLTISPEQAARVISASQ